MRCPPLVVVLALAVACNRPPRTDVAPTGTPVTVVVHSDYTQPMDVYVLGNSTTMRLGIVHPGVVSTFKMPATMLQSGTSVELVARVVAGGATARSGPQFLQAGVTVDFYVTLRLFNSYAAVRQ